MPNMHTPTHPMPYGHTSCQSQIVSNFQNSINNYNIHDYSLILVFPVIPNFPFIPIIPFFQIFSKILVIRFIRIILVIHVYSSIPVNHGILIISNCILFSDFTIQLQLRA